MIDIDTLKSYFVVWGAGRELFRISYATGEVTLGEEISPSEAARGFFEELSRIGVENTRGHFMRKEIDRLSAIVEDQKVVIQDERSCVEQWKGAAKFRAERINQLREDLAKVTAERDRERAQANEWLAQSHDLKKEVALAREEMKAAQDHAIDLVRQREELKAQLSKRDPWCAYCLKVIDESGVNAVRIHVESCEKHPLAAANAAVQAARDELDRLRIAHAAEIARLEKDLNSNNHYYAEWQAAARDLKKALDERDATLKHWNETGGLYQGKLTELAAVVAERDRLRATLTNVKHSLKELLRRSEFTGPLAGPIRGPINDILYRIQQEEGTPSARERALQDAIDVIEAAVKKVKNIS